MGRIETLRTLLAAALLASATAARAVSVDEDARALVGGNADFALDIYAELRGRDGNLFLSPYGLSTALAMAYAGARARTEDQMADVLRFELPQDRLHEAFGALGGRLRAGGEGGSYRLEMANALWAQEGHGLREEFRDLLAGSYRAGLEEVDFARAPERARRTINAWVSARTERRVRELLRHGDLGPATALVLTNAIRFEGSWAARFDERQTRDAPFRTGGGEVTVPFMNRTARLALATEPGLDVLELPYGDGRLSMVVLLPKADDGLAGLEASLTGENLERWLSRLRERAVRLSLPRLEVETRLDVSRTLQEMGMTDAFHAARADFSGITGRRDLFLSLVVQQARVEVSEQGTEAAAGTAVVLERGGKPVAFVADRPFLFLVRDRRSGSILFVGRVVNPAAG